MIEKQLVDFVNEMPSGFEAQVIKFSDNIQVKSGFSSDKQLLIKHLKSTNPRGSCALWDAMKYGAQEFMAGSESSSFLFEIVLTAGKDTGSKISMEEFKNSVIPRCEENSVLFLILGLSDNTEPKFTTSINPDIFISGNFSYSTRKNGSGSSNSFINGFENYLNINFKYFWYILESYYIFIFPDVIELDDIKVIYLVKKKGEGKIETIQDFYTNSVFLDHNPSSFWIITNFFKLLEESIAKLQPPKDKREKYISNLSFMDAITKSTMLDTELRALLDEAVLYGMKAANQLNNELHINEPDHTIANTDGNVNRLVNITFNPNLSKNEKINQIISDLMTPNVVDVIVTGQYVDDVTNPLISIRPLTISKSSQKIVTKNLQFNREELICRHPQSGKQMLCKNAFDKIAKAVQELLEQL